MTLSRYSVDQMPDQTGRTFLITGANSGIGYEAAKHIARKNARIVMACRDPHKSDEAAARLRSETGAEVEVRALDLANLSSVRDFAGAFSRDHQALHVLINNAGVMACPRRTTADGFEMQLGTNHLGHFALTGLLLDRLLATPGSRVVTVSSAMHRMGKIRFADLMGERSYSRWPAYAQSKLANLLFAYELDRKLRAKGAATISAACHPGYSATNLQHAGPNLDGTTMAGRFMRLTNKLVAQSAEMGALPTVYAATAPEVEGGQYFGPDGLFEAAGYPVRVKSSKRSHDREAAAQLWARSEDLTGVHYAALA